MHKNACGGETIFLYKEETYQNMERYKMSSHHGLTDQEIFGILYPLNRLKLHLARIGEMKWHEIFYSLEKHIFRLQRQLTKNIYT